MMRSKLKKELIDAFGQEAFEIAVALVQESDADGAWAAALDMGLEDVADIIEELYFEGD